MPREAVAGPLVAPLAGTGDDALAVVCAVARSRVRNIHGEGSSPDDQTSGPAVHAGTCLWLQCRCPTPHAGGHLTITKCNAQLKQSSRSDARSVICREYQRLAAFGDRRSYQCPGGTDCHCQSVPGATCAAQDIFLVDYLLVRERACLHPISHCHGCVQSKWGRPNDVSQRQFQRIGRNRHCCCRDRARSPGLVQFDPARISRRVEKPK